MNRRHSILVDFDLVLIKTDEQLTSSPLSSLQSNQTLFSVSLSLLSSPRKRKHSYLELVPLNKMLFNIMKPVHQSKNDSTPVTVNTNVIKSVIVDFPMYTCNQNLVTIGDDSSSDDGEIRYCEHCLIPF